MQEEITQLAKDNAKIASLKNKAKHDRLKKDAYDEAYKNAEQDLKDVLLRDFVNLYVGEGTKKSKSVVITNSDLHTILACFTAMKKFFLKENKFINVDIKYYEANDNGEELLRYWSNLLGHHDFIKFKTYVQKRGNPNPDDHNNSNKFGLITVSIHDVYAKEKLYAYMNYLKEKWQKDFELTFSTKINQSIEQVVSEKKI